MTDLSEYHSSIDQAILESFEQGDAITSQASSTALCASVDQPQFHFGGSITSIALASNPDDEYEDDNDEYDLDELDDDDDDDDDEDDSFSTNIGDD